MRLPSESPSPRTCSALLHRAYWHLGRVALEVLKEISVQRGMHFSPFQKQLPLFCVLTLLMGVGFSHQLQAGPWGEMSCVPDEGANLGIVDAWRGLWRRDARVECEEGGETSLDLTKSSHKELAVTAARQDKESNALQGNFSRSQYDNGSHIIEYLPQNNGDERHYNNGSIALYEGINAAMNEVLRKESAFVKAICLIVSDRNELNAWLEKRTPIEGEEEWTLEKIRGTSLENILKGIEAYNIVELCKRFNCFSQTPNNMLRDQGIQSMEGQGIDPRQAVLHSCVIWYATQANAKLWKKKAVENLVQNFDNKLAMRMLRREVEFAAQAQDLATYYLKELTKITRNIQWHEVGEE